MDELQAHVLLYVAEFKVRTQRAGISAVKNLLSEGETLIRSFRPVLVTETPGNTPGESFDKEREDKYRMLEEQVAFLKQQMMLMVQAAQANQVQPEEKAVDRHVTKRNKSMLDKSKLIETPETPPRDPEQGLTEFLSPEPGNIPGTPFLNGPPIDTGARGPPLSALNAAACSVDIAGPPVDDSFSPPLSVLNSLLVSNGNGPNIDTSFAPPPSAFQIASQLPKSCLKSKKEETHIEPSKPVSAEEMIVAKARLRNKTAQVSSDFVLPNGSKVFVRKLVEEDEKIDFITEVKLAAKVKLRKTVAFRSPGGTPLRDLNEDKENNDPFKQALMKKFQNVASPLKKPIQVSRPSLGRRLELESARAYNEVHEVEWIAK